MTLKDKFLEISSYEEFDKRREEFKQLKIDEDVKKHLGKIFPKAFAPQDKHSDVSLK